jgi:transitional endoplasmic reticulum ATPase
LRDFRVGLSRVRPSSLRLRRTVNSGTSWEDVGGLSAVKHKLQQAIEWPFRYAASFRRLSIRPPRGILLHGPPGIAVRCGVWHSSA